MSLGLLSLTLLSTMPWLPVLEVLGVPLLLCTLTPLRMLPAILAFMECIDGMRTAADSSQMESSDQSDSETSASCRECSAETAFSSASTDSSQMESDQSESGASTSCGDGDSRSGGVAGGDSTGLREGEGNFLGRSFSELGVSLTIASPLSKICRPASSCSSSTSSTIKSATWSPGRSFGSFLPKSSWSIIASQWTPMSKTMPTRLITLTTRPFTLSAMRGDVFRTVDLCGSLAELFGLSLIGVLRADVDVCCACGTSAFGGTSPLRMICAQPCASGSTSKMCRLATSSPRRKRGSFLP
mmetsp:Transcript_117029/g.212939  ORF Transcript_117029/g.212939 Transcript_117029/m.212939 type:complete len:299 (-) Transcript_117029:200-1096(-)